MAARMKAIEHELQRFTLEKGLNDDDDNDDESTGEDAFSWWCRHQFEYPTLATLAKKYLAITASSAASERVFLAAGNVVTKSAISWEMTLSTPSCFWTVRTDWHGQAESRRRRSAGRPSNFSFSCGGDGWVREYVYKSFRIALYTIIYILC